MGYTEAFSVRVSTRAGGVCEHTGLGVQYVNIQASEMEAASPVVFSCCDSKYVRLDNHAMLCV
jgi:hypothetical protein